MAPSSYRKMTHIECPSAEPVKPSPIFKATMQRNATTTSSCPKILVVFDLTISITALVGNDGQGKGEWGWIVKSRAKHFAGKSNFQGNFINGNRPKIRRPK